MPLSEEVKEIISTTIENGSRGLNLSLNNIGKEGAKALAEGLKDTNITELDFGCNNIGAEGVEALNKALEANCERIEDEVKKFKDKFLSINNEFKDLKDIGLNIKLGFIKLLHKFGKYAFAKHIKEFLKLNEEECTIVNKLDETAAPIKVEIACKIPIIGNNIASKISKFLNIEDCLQLNDATEKDSTQGQTSSIEEVGQELQPSNSSAIKEEQTKSDITKNKRLKIKNIPLKKIPEDCLQLNDATEKDSTQGQTSSIEEVGQELQSSGEDGSHHHDNANEKSQLSTLLASVESSQFDYPTKSVSNPSSSSGEVWQGSHHHDANDQVTVDLIGLDGSD